VSRSSKGHFLSSKQVQAIADDVARAHPMYGLIVRFVAAVGCGPGEVSGLQLRDVDLDRGVIHVRRHPHPGQTSSGGGSSGPPSPSGQVREVPVLDEVLLAELADFLTRHPQLR
jgi:integrase